MKYQKKKKNDKEQVKLIDLVRHVHRPGTYVDQPSTLYQPGTYVYQPSPYVFLIGDFNCFPWSKGLEMDKYVNLFPLRKYTNTKQDECYDNIIVPDTRLCCNVVVVSDCDLKKVSDHFPIYADFWLHWTTSQCIIKHFKLVLTSNFF